MKNPVQFWVKINSSMPRCADIAEISRRYRTAWAMPPVLAGDALAGLASPASCSPPAHRSAGLGGEFSDDLLCFRRYVPRRLTAPGRQGGSILITSQLPVTAWHDVIDEPTFADAILDHLVHNAHRLELDGHSMRRSGSPSEK